MIERRDERFVEQVGKRTVSDIVSVLKQTSPLSKQPCSLNRFYDAEAFVLQPKSAPFTNHAGSEPTTWDSSRNDGVSGRDT